MNKALHIECPKEDIAPLVIMPGDPLRAKYIAQKFLENPVLINKIRNMFGYTGFYKGVRVTVMSSGMGMPSISIYAMELFQFYEVEKIIRVGTCGAVNAKVKIRDIILGDKYYTNSNFADSYSDEDVHIVYPNQALNEKIIETANSTGINLLVGPIITMDNFGPYIDRRVLKSNIPAGLNALGEEMEGFALVYLADKLNKEGTCMATVVDSKFSDEVLPPKERETTLDNMILLALDSIIK